MDQPLSISMMVAPISRAARALPIPTWDQLLFFLALALAGGLVAVAPTIPHDFWWHLKVGQIVAAQGIPTTNRFAWTLPADQPFTYAAWLAEWLMYQLTRLGGPAAPVLLRNLLALLAFGLVGLHAQRRSGSWRLAALAVLVAASMAADNLSTRPQNFSWPLFAVFALLLHAAAAGRLRTRVLLALPLLMALWVNLHGAFVLGLALVGLVCLGEALRFLLRRPGALLRQQLAGLAAVAAATTAAALLNPLGLGIVRYVTGIATDPAVQALVSEWQPPTTHNLPGLLFFLALLALPLAWLFSRQRPTLTDGLLAGVFAILAARSQRDVVWFGMLAAPLLAQCLAAPSTRQALRGAKSVPARPAHRAPHGRAIPPHSQPPMAPASTTPRPQGANRATRALLTLALVIGLIAVQPPFSLRLPITGRRPDSYADVPGAPRLFAHDTPVAAVEYLRQHPQAGRLFNEMGYGSYLIWALGETTPVFADPRVELYPLTRWQDYLAISTAHTVNPLMIDTYHVERVLASARTQPRLIAALAADPTHWAVEYRDAESVIYQRVR